MSRRKPLFLGLVIALVTASIFLSRYSSDDGRNLTVAIDGVEPSATSRPKDKEPQTCKEHLGWLEPYQFTYPIQYVSRDIIAKPRADAQRPSLTLMDKPLFPKSRNVDLAKSQILSVDDCLPPLVLDVPHSEMMKVDASNMIFGMQTTIKRLRETVKHLARWLPGTGARLYAMVIESEEVAAKDSEMRALEKEFRDRGMNVSIVHPVRSKDEFAQRYFSLVHVMYRARDEKTQWISCIDDDTFFPSMWDLQNMLKEHNWQKEQYISSLSEDWWAVNHYGLMGFGGAGILLSLPMAKVIDDHHDVCVEHLRTTSGDVSVMDCIYKFSTTKLTHIPGLHQVDMHGDLSGFYESGREMISLHHWKEGSAAGYKLEMEKMHLVADICDSCFLQRWQFPNELLLSNGFSITSYPKGHLSGNTGILGSSEDKLNLDQMEHTWGDNIDVLHSLAPIREKMSEETKIGYKLLDSIFVNGEEIGAPNQKVVRQIYFKEGVEGEGKDTVMVLNWRSGAP